MQKISHRHTANKKLIRKELYTVDEAIKLLKLTANAKFIETTELHANLNVDPKYADQQLRATVTLPHGTGKNARIAAFVSDDQFEDAQQAGADIVGNEELLEDIRNGIINFDLLISTPEMMPNLAKLGRILGPKGLMPSPKAGTVSINLTQTLNDFKKGKFEYKSDKTGIVHISFGKTNFNSIQLKENLVTLQKSIVQNRPPGVKRKYFNTLYVCNSMGPSIQLDLTDFE